MALFHARTMAASSQRERKRCSCWVPIALDLVFEAYRSKLLVVIVLLTILGALAQKVLGWHPKPCFIGLWQLDPSSQPTTGTEIALLQNLAQATDVFEFLYPALALLGVSRWQSGWFLLPALAGALAQVGLLTLIDANYCFQLAKYGDTRIVSQSQNSGLIDFFTTARFIVYYRLFVWSAAVAASLILFYLVVAHIVLPSLAGCKLMTLADAGAGAAAADVASGDYAQLSSAEAGVFKSAAGGSNGGTCSSHKDKQPFVPDMVIAYKRLHEFERNAADDASVCAAGVWLWHRLSLTPLRHWLAPRSRRSSFATSPRWASAFSHFFPAARARRHHPRRSASSTSPASTTPTRPDISSCTRRRCSLCASSSA